MEILAQLLINSLIIYLASYILPGVYVDNFTTAIFITILLALINVSIKPLMILLTLPITILSFGMFLFVINALIIILITKIIPGFQVYSIWWAIIFSITISVIGSILRVSLNKDK